MTPADDYPPCAICGGPNDIGEVCAKCAKTNDPFSEAVSESYSARADLQWEPK